MSITIAMNTYNNAKTVAEAIESILAQSFTDWKLSIIDANSSDITLEICERYSSLDHRITVSKSSSRQSWVESTCQQITATNTEFFMILDADDRISYDWIELLLTSVNHRGSIGGYGSTKRIDFIGSEYFTNLSHGQRYRFTASKFRFIRVLSALLYPESLGLVNLCYSVWKTDVFYDIAIKSGFFSDKLPWTIDFDRVFILECLWRGSVQSVPAVSIYRRTKDTIPSWESFAMRDFRFSFRKILKRRTLMIIQLFRIKPSVKLILWWMKQKRIRYMFLPVLILRILLSVFSRQIDEVMGKVSRTIR